MKNLTKAIIKVMSEVKGMEKNSVVGENTKSPYNGTKDQDVKEVFNNAFERAGLAILPIEIEPTVHVDRYDSKDYNGNPTRKQSVFTEVKTKYLLIHSESGESQEIVGYGQGVDTQDKSAGKATTYALKNALLYTFLTPVGKIDDTEVTHSQEIEIPQTRIRQRINKVKEPKRWQALIDKLNSGKTIKEIEEYFIFTDSQKKELLESII